MKLVAALHARTFLSPRPDLPTWCTKFAKIYVAYAEAYYRSMGKYPFTLYSKLAPLHQLGGEDSIGLPSCVSVGLTFNPDAA